MELPADLVGVDDINEVTGLLEKCRRLDSRSGGRDINGREERPWRVTARRSGATSPSR